MKVGITANPHTPDSLDAAQAASRRQGLDLAKEGVRVLSTWPNASPAPGLLELARTGPDPAHPPWCPDGVGAGADLGGGGRYETEESVKQ